MIATFTIEAHKDPHGSWVARFTAITTAGQEITGRTHTAPLRALVVRDVLADLVVADIEGRA